MPLSPEQQQREAERLVAQRQREEQKAAESAARQAHKTEQTQVEAGYRAQGMTPWTGADGNLYPDPLFEQKQAEKARKEQEKAAKEAADLAAKQQRADLTRKGIRHAINPVDGTPIPLESEQAVEQRRKDAAEKLRKQQIDDQIKAAEAEHGAKVAAYEAQGIKPLTEKGLAKAKNDALFALQSHYQAKAKGTDKQGWWDVVNNNATPEAKAAQEALTRLQSPDAELTDDDLATLEANDATKPLVDKYRKIQELQKFHAEHGTRLADLILHRDAPDKWAESVRTRRAQLPPEQLKAELETSRADLEARSQALQDQASKLNGAVAAHQLELDTLSQQAAARRSQGIPAGEIVSYQNEDGTTEHWPHDLAVKREAVVAKLQDTQAQQADAWAQLHVQQQELQRDAALHDEGNQILHGHDQVAAAAQSQQQQGAHAQTLASLRSLPGGEIAAADYQRITADAQTRRDDLFAVYDGQPPPEAVKALNDDIQTQLQTLEAGHQQRWEAAKAAYSDLKQFSSPNASGDSPTGHEVEQRKTAIAQNLATVLNLPPQEVQNLISDAASMDWSPPPPPFSKGMLADVVEGTARWMVDGVESMLPGQPEQTPEQTRLLSNGSLVVNPSITSEKDYTAAVSAANATPEAKAAALARFPAIHEAAGQQVLEGLQEIAGIYGPDAIADYTRSLKDKPKDVSEPEWAMRFTEKMKAESRNGVLNTLKSLAWEAWTSFNEGFVDQRTFAAGLAGGVLPNGLGSETMMNDARWSQRKAGALESGLELGGDLSTNPVAKGIFHQAPRFIGSLIGPGIVARGSGKALQLFAGTKLGGKLLPSLAAVLAESATPAQTLKAVNALTRAGKAGAGVAGGLQTYGSQITDIYTALKLQHPEMSHAEALRAAQAPSLLSAGVTALLTTFVPGGAEKILARPAAARELVRQKFTNRLAQLMHVGKEFFKHSGMEGIEELPDELYSQYQAAVASHPGDPTAGPKAVAQYLSMLPELAVGVGVMGGTGGAVSAAQESSLSQSQSLTVSKSPSPANLPETVAAAEAAIDSFADPNLDEATVARTQDAARGVLYIAQGTPLTDLDADTLAALDIVEDPQKPGTFINGRIVPNAKVQEYPAGMAPTTNPDGTPGMGRPVRVKLVDGQPVISQQTLDNLETKMPAVRAAIPLNEKDRITQLASPSPNSANNAGKMAEGQNQGHRGNNPGSAPESPAKDGDEAAKRLGAVTTKNGTTIDFADIEFESKSQEPGKNYGDKPGPVVVTRGKAKVLDFTGRKVVHVVVNGVKVPFYLSTGKAGKKNVQSGKWYPVFGFAPSDGWLNKGSEAEINNYYGSPELREVAEHLDRTLGDMRNANVQKIGIKGPQHAALNEGLSPTDNGEPLTRQRLAANIAATIARIEAGRKKPASTVDTTANNSANNAGKMAEGQNQGHRGNNPGSAPETGSNATTSPVQAPAGQGHETPRSQQAPAQSGSPVAEGAGISQPPSGSDSTPSSLSPSHEQRAAELATVLEDRKVPAHHALPIARAIVAQQGIVGASAEEQFTRTPEGSAITHVDDILNRQFGYVRGTGRNYSQVDPSKAPAASPTDPFTPAASTAASTAASSLTDGMVVAKQKAMKAVPVQHRARFQKFYTELDKTLTRYAPAFPGGVRFVDNAEGGIKGTGAGIQVADASTNPALEIDLAELFASSTVTDAKGLPAFVKRAVLHEIRHIAALKVITKQQARDLWAALTPKLKNRVYASYYAASLTNTVGRQLTERELLELANQANTGRVSSIKLKPGAALPKAEGFHMAHEFLRMLDEDAEFAGQTSEAMDAHPGLGKAILDFLASVIDQIKKLIDTDLDATTRVAVKEMQKLVEGARKKLLAGLPPPDKTYKGAPPPNLAAATDNRPSVISGQPGTRNQEPKTAFKPVLGSVGTAYTDSNDPIEFQWAVVDVNSLNVSNDDTGRINPAYPQELQPRDRTSAASEAQVNDIAKNFNLDRLSASSSVGDGAPITGPDAVVESGNGRIMGARRAHTTSNPSAKSYRDALIRRAAEFGLNAEQVEAVPNPVLIRIRRTDVNRTAFVLAANVSTIAPKREMEQAKIDSKQIVPDLFDSFVPSENGDIFTAANADFIRAFVSQVIPPAERGQVIDASGNLSQSGLRRIRNALFVHAYGTSPEALNALGRLTESIEATDVNLARALLAMAPRFAEQNARIANGTLYPLSITENLAQALQKLSDLRNRGQSIESWLQEDRIPGIGDDPGPVTTELVKFLHANRQRPRQILDALDRYAKALDGAGDPHQMSMFGDEKPTQETLWKLAANYKEPALAMGAKSVNSVPEELRYAQFVQGGTGEGGGLVTARIRARIEAAEAEGRVEIAAGGHGSLMVWPDEAAFVRDHGFGRTHLNTTALAMYQAAQAGSEPAMQYHADNLEREMVDNLDEHPETARNAAQELMQAARQVAGGNKQGGEGRPLGEASGTTAPVTTESQPEYPPASTLQKAATTVLPPKAALKLYRTLTAKQDAGTQLTAGQSQALEKAEQSLGQTFLFDTPNKTLKPAEDLVLEQQTASRATFADSTPEQLKLFMGAKTVDDYEEPPPETAEETAAMDAEFAKARQAKPKLDDFTRSLAAEFNATPVIPPKLKGRERTLAKMRKDYKGDATRLKDLARTTIETKDLAQAKAVVAEIERRTGKKAKRNLFDANPVDGYRDALFNLEFDGYTVELQVHVPEILATKHHLHHAYVVRTEIERRAESQNRQPTLEEWLKIDRMNRIMRRAYNQALGLDPDLGAPPEELARRRAGTRSSASSGFTRNPPLALTSSSEIGRGGSSSNAQPLPSESRTTANASNRSDSSGTSMNPVAPGNSDGFFTPEDTPKPAETQGVRITTNNILQYAGNVDVSALKGRQKDWRQAFEVPGTPRLVPLAKLVSPKNELADPKFKAGQKKDPRQNAADWIVKTMNQEPGTKKRAPLDVSDNGDGTFTIHDGNATAQALMLAGWKAVPVNVIEAPRDTLAKAPTTVDSGPDLFSFNTGLGLDTLLTPAQKQAKVSQSQTLDLFGGTPNEKPRPASQRPARPVTPPRSQAPAQQPEGFGELFAQPGMAGESGGDSGTTRPAGQPGSLGTGGNDAAGGNVAGESLRRPITQLGGSGGESMSGKQGDAPSDDSRTPARLERPSLDSPARNFAPPADLDRLAPAGNKAKIRANLDAITLLKRLYAENRDATPEEKRTLAAYSGWGAFKEAFNDGYADRREFYKNNPHYLSYNPGYQSWEKNWGELHDTLKKELTEDEYRAASRSTLNAHYTAAPVIRAMWKMLERLGFKGGRALEPSAGAGHYLGLQPAGDIADRTQWQTVELDDLSARLLAKLYPEAAVNERHGGHPGRQIDGLGFERARIPNGSLDLVISNVPFHESGPRKKGFPNLNLHNFFFAHALDKVKPGGLVAFITSSSTMQNNQKQRDFIASKGDLVAAFRLPNNAFKENAGTEVVTDILILRKPDGTPFKGESWKSLVEVGRQTITLTQGKDQLADDLRREAKNTGNVLREYSKNGVKAIDVDAPILVNEYFAAHPEHVLGTHSLQGSMYRGNEYTVTAPDGMDVGATLDRLAATLPENVMGTQAAAAGDRALAAYGDRPFSFVEREGKFYEVQDDGTMQEAEWATNPAMVKTFRSWLRVKTALRSLIDAESQPATPDAALVPLRSALNIAYDTHIATHGYISRRFGNKHTHLYSDPEYPLTAALENEKIKTDPKTGKRTYSYPKATILQKRVMKPIAEPTKASDIQDAIEKSLAWRGMISPHYMASLLGTSTEDVNAQLDTVPDIFEDPGTSTYEHAETYLTGNIRTKLDAAEEAAKDNPKFKKNADALRAVMPERRTIAAADPSLGERWIPGPVYDAFIREVLGGSDKAEYIPAGNQWRLDGTHLYRNADYDTDRMGSHEILDHALSLKEPMIYDRSKDATVFNATATAAAKASLTKMRRAFNEFVKTSEVEVEIENADGEKVTLPVWKAAEDTYNETMNNFVTPKQKGDYLQFPGLSEDVWRTAHRRAVIARFLAERRGMMAHGVGSGKTFNQIILSKELRRLGLAKKPLIVVQNSTLGQFAASYMQAYPSARILVPTERDLQTQNRRKLVSKIATGDYDAVILSHSQFDLISNKPESVRAYMGEKIDELKDLILRAKGGDRSKVRDLEGMLKRLEDRLAGMLDALKGRQDSTIYFEDLGVDALIVDEAHNYKSIPIVTRMGRVKGVPSGADSQRAIGMLLKARHVQSKTGGKNVFLATGTPVKNSMAEAYIMMDLMAPDVLAEYKIYNFDDFATAYGEVVSSTEISWSGAPKVESRFAKFKKGRELITMIRSVFDVAMGNDKLGLKVPKVKGGAPSLDIVPVTPTIERFNAWVRSVADRWAAASGKKKEEFTAVPIMTLQAGIVAALDPRLLAPGAPDHANSKVNTAVRDMLRLYHEGTPKKTTQIVFADLRRPFNMEYLSDFAGHPFPEYASGAGDFDLYEDIKKKLIAGGVPEKEILLMDPSMSKAKRTAMFEKVSSGEIRIAIGSTETLGVGVNVQERLKALHHLMPPRDFTPAMHEQRNGRAIRQGNLHYEWNEEIEVHQWGTEGSMDSAVYGTLGRKQRFITQLLMGEIGSDSFDDPTDPIAVNLAEMAARTMGDPDFIRRIEVEKELRDLRLESDAFASELSSRRSRLSSAEFYMGEYPKYIAVAREKIDKLRHLWTRTAPRPEGVKETTDISDKPVYEFGGKVIDTAAKEGGILTPLDLWLADESKTMERQGKKQSVGLPLTVNGIPFTVQVETTMPGSHTPGTLNFEGRSLGQFNGAEGLVRSLRSILPDLRGNIDQYQRLLENSTQQAASLRELLERDKEFSRKGELQTLEDELAAVDARLAAKAAPPQPQGQAASANDTTLPPLKPVNPNLLTAAVRDVLENSWLVGTKLFLPENLDRKLYQRVNAALESVGGQWNKKQQAHLFSANPSQFLGIDIEDRTHTPDTLAMGSKAVYSPDQPHGNARPDPHTGTPSLIHGRSVPASAAKAIYRHLERILTSPRPAPGQPGPGAGDAGSLRTPLVNLADFGFPGTDPRQKPTSGPLEHIGGEAEATVYADRERGVVYKFLHGFRGEGSKGAYPQPLYNAKGRLTWKLRPAPSERALLARLAMMNAVGGTPTELLGVTPQGHYVLKQPFSADPETTRSTSIAEELERNGLIPIPASVFDDPKHPPAWIAVHRGKPWLFTDLRRDNFIGDTQNAPRIADPLVAPIIPRLLSKVPALRPLVQQAAKAAKQLGDRSDRLFMASKSLHYGMASDSGAAHNAEPSPGGLSEAEARKGGVLTLFHRGPAGFAFEAPMFFAAQDIGPSYGSELRQAFVSIKEPAQDADVIKAAATIGMKKRGFKAYEYFSPNLMDSPFNTRDVERLMVELERQGFDGAVVKDSDVPFSVIPFTSAQIRKVNPESSLAEGGTNDTLAKASTSLTSRFLSGAQNLTLNTLEGGFGAAAATAKATGLQAPLNRLGWNHLDRSLSAKIAALTRWIHDKTHAAEIVAKWTNTSHQADFINRVADDRDLLSPVDKPGFTAIPVEPRYGRLAGKFVIDAVAQQVLKFQAPNVKVAQMMKVAHALKREFLPDSVLPREILAKKREMEIKTAMGSQRAMDLVRALSGNPKFSDLAYPKEFAENPVHRRNLYEAMTGERPLSSLPPEMQTLAHKLRAILVSIGQEAVKQGRMSVDTFDNLRGTYMPHFYKEDVQKEKSLFHKFRLGVRDILAQRTTAWHITDTSQKDANGDYRLVSHSGNQWRFRSPEHMNAFYEDFINQQALAELHTRYGKKFRTLTAADLMTPSKLDPEIRGRLQEIKRTLTDRFQRHKPLTIAEQEKAGLIMDPVYAIARYAAQMAHDNSTAEFFNTIAADKSLISAIATPGFTEIPDNPRFGRLAGQWVQDDIANQVLEMIEAPNIALQIYDTLLGWWKTGKTVLNPGTHVRNVLGNLFFSQLAGNSVWNPGNATYYKQAIAALRNGGPVLTEAYDQGVLGADFVSAELRQTLRQLLPDPATIVDDGKAGGLIMGIGKAIGKFIGNPANAAYNKAAALYQAEDEVFKLAAYLKAKAIFQQQGTKNEELSTMAAGHVRQWFPYFDSGSSGTLKLLGRTAMPFLGFYRESIRIFGHALKERPLALATGLAIPSIITMLSAMALGLDDDDLDEIKKDMRGKTGKLLGFVGLDGRPWFSMLLPVRSDTGQVQQFDISAVHPFVDFLGTRVEGGKQDGWWPSMFRSFVAAGPLGNLLYSNMTGEDAFFGSTIVEPNMTTGEAFAARASNAAKTLLPPLVPGGTGFGTLLNMGSRTTGKTLEVRSPAQAVLRTVGGLDVRNATPDLYRLADDWRREHGYEVQEGMDYGSTTPASRARSALFKVLAQDNPNPKALKNILAKLKEMGHPVRTEQDINRLLFYKDPMKLIGGNKAKNITATDAQAQFRSSLTGEARQALESALAEYQRIKQKAPSLIRAAQ